MKQLFHIFAKDTRRFWPEILLSLATLVAMVAVYPAQWQRPTGVAGQLYNEFLHQHWLMNGMCSLLVLAGWVLLISRVIQAEALVGDRQFWTTRPYGWKPLLGAKLLFLAVYLYLPLAAAQCICIALSGLNPLTGISSIAVYLFLLTGLVALPAMALATITASQSKLIYTAIGVLLCVILVPAIWFNHLDLFDFLGNPLRYWNAAVVLTILCLAVIVLQYATRRTVLARAILGAGVAALILSAHAISAHANIRTHANVRQTFETSTFAPVAQAPFEITYNPAAARKPYAFVPMDSPERNGSVVDLRIPLTYAAIGNDAAVHPLMYGVELEGTDGFRWSTMQNDLWPEEYHAKQIFPAGFLVPIAVYNRLKSSPVTMKLTLYYDELQPVDQARSTLNGGSVDAAGSVHCVVGFNNAWLSCRTAARQTPILNVNADFSVDSCPASQPELAQGAGAWWSYGRYFIQSATPSLVPLREFAFTFADDRNNATGGTHLCTGAPFTITHYQLAGRRQATFTIRDLPLPEPRK